MRYPIVLFLSLFVFLACSEKPIHTNETDEMYFPPLNSSSWATMSLTDANFNESNLSDLFDYLEEKDTKGFIVLKNGKIVIEAYFNGHSQNANWYWASAGKTLTATTVGIAQQEGYLSINDKTSDYLGQGWTNTPIEKENLISIKNQLSMTTGLNDLIFYCTDPICLNYKADAGTRWAYHNGPYTLLQSVVANAVNQDFNTYFDTKIKNKIGMDGTWINSGYNKLFNSTTRSMARFGLLILNEGVWDSEPILNDITFYNEMINTSQNLNQSYGYLWWLNGKDSFRIPQSQEEFTGSIIPEAPSDLIAGLGANDQKLYIIPSQKLVIVRMGETAGDENLSISGFDNILWQKINAVINN